jgi:hypothetical protein
MIIRTLLLCVFAAAPLAAQFSFEKVEVRTGYTEAREGDKGMLQFVPGEIRFLNENGVQLFAIKADKASKLFYSSIEGRRSGTPLSKPFDLLGGKRHFLTISFENESLAGAIEFKLHKSNYQSIIRNAEILTGLTLERDEPERAVQAEAPAAVEPPSPAVLDIRSTPQLAEVEIDSSFNGLTPRRKSVEAGDYRIVISKAGYEPVEKRVSVDPGQTLEVHVELRPLRASAR